MRAVLTEVVEPEQRARSKVNVPRLGINLKIDLVFKANRSGEDYLQKLRLAVHHGSFRKGFQRGLQSGHGLRGRSAAVACLRRQAS